MAEKSSRDSSKRLAIGAIRAFEEWLALTKGDNYVFDNADIQEFDNLLAEFFLTTRKKNGLDYSANSLVSLRTGFSFYIKAKGLSPQGLNWTDFPKAQTAFHQRKQRLSFSDYQMLPVNYPPRPPSQENISSLDLAAQEH